MNKTKENKAIMGTVLWVVQETYNNLVDFRNQENREAFNKELLRLMPQVKNYVAIRLKNAIRAGKLNKGMFDPNDFTDQLFIEVYDNWELVKNEYGLRPFLFKKVDDLLDDRLTEEEFDHIFFENIDTYSKKEWDAMEEDFSTDGDGDLVLLEELDDSSLDRTNYSLDHVFITEEEKGLAQKLDESLDKERVERHMDMVLGKMSLPMRCVFELYTDQGFTPDEIADMRNTTLEETENLLSSARGLLKKSFVKRFLIDSN
ncbi:MULTISPECIES: sigma-70 family RNA polymerase sigma factor [Maribacter]|uniref:Sigma-70 family RNA polymerase sigma factor n=1 Tax=Maribacter flavus TaxID=1658664 RepID=A0ABU7IGK9_9FLAO|nr:MULTISPECIES: sigma-70 family RNA polymerase sigma factor [Maribacter]MDC6405210.1 sigma-70 family RNA polymerase sigma factor [Maribacter sp. PR66]MEE1971981.1 sigma-70 family RNA polymerase sigma factor [Maribacter flavus]